MKRPGRRTAGGARGRARLAARAVIVRRGGRRGSRRRGLQQLEQRQRRRQHELRPGRGRLRGGRGHRFRAARAAPAGSPIEIGSIIDLTGVDATSGTAQQAGMSYFLQQLNSSGGVNGHPLKVTYCDAASTPQGAAQCAQQFASLSSHIVVTQTDDPPTRGALPYLTKDLVVSIDPILLPKAGTNVFQSAGSSSRIADALVAAVKKSNLHTIGVLYTTDTSGTHQLEAAQASAKAAGITVVSQPQTAGTTDVTPQLLKLKSSGADVIYLASIGANTAAAVSSYKTLGLTIPVVVGAAAVTNSFLKSLPGALPQNLYGVSELIGDTSGLSPAVVSAWSQYRSAFTKYASQPVDTQTTSAIYLGCVVQTALKASPTYSVSEMTQALKTAHDPVPRVPGEVRHPRTQRGLQSAGRGHQGGRDARPTAGALTRATSRDKRRHPRRAPRARRRRRTEAAMALFLQTIFSSLINGSVFALMGVGIVLCYRSSGIVNLAQGETFMIAGILTAKMVTWGVPLGLGRPGRRRRGDAGGGAVRAGGAAVPAALAARAPHHRHRRRRVPGRGRGRPRSRGRPVRVRQRAQRVAADRRRLGDQPAGRAAGRGHRGRSAWASSGSSAARCSARR